MSPCGSRRCWASVSTRIWLGKRFLTGQGEAPESAFDESDMAGQALTVLLQRRRLAAAAAIRQLHGQ